MLTSQLQDPLARAISYTIFDEPSNLYICNITFLAADLQCLPVIEGRLAHALTHGIRSSLAHNYNAMYMVNTSKPYLIDTPRKPPHRHFRSATLFGMTESEFSAEYWVEHNMFGGVVVALYGSYCPRDPVTSKIANYPIAIPAAGIFFRINHSQSMGPYSTQSIVCLVLQL
jgi:hypothetical protein